MKRENMDNMEDAIESFVKANPYGWCYPGLRCR
jgi:hypothetical protein